MTALKHYLKPVAVFFALLVVLQGCSIYKTGSVSLEEASRSNTKVKITTIDNKTLKFDKLVVANDNIMGIRNANQRMTPIDEASIKTIQIKDKTASTVIIIGILTVVTVGLFVALFDSAADIDLTQ